MNLQEVFEHLQEHQVLKLQMTSAKDADNMRIMLLRKWRVYKEGLDKLGFLDSDTAKLGISLEHGKVMEDGTQEFAFYLRPRKVRGKVEYKILGINGSNGEDDA